MRFGGALIPAFAVASLGQQIERGPDLTPQEQAMVERIKKRIDLAELEARASEQLRERLALPDTGNCSIRLVEMAPPKDVKFSMPTAGVDKPVHPMPQAKVPAPPCPKDHVTSRMITAPAREK